jgi:hypothetical protein
MLPVQKMSAAETGDTAADDGDSFHGIREV